MRKLNHIAWSLVSANLISGVLSGVSTGALLFLSDSFVARFSVLLAYSGVLSSIVPLGREWSILRSSSSDETAAAVATSLLLSGLLFFPLVFFQPSALSAHSAAGILAFGGFYAVGRSLRYEAVRTSDKKKIWWFSCAPPFARIVGLVFAYKWNIPVVSVLLFETSVRVLPTFQFWLKKNRVARAIPSGFELGMLFTAVLGTLTTAILTGWTHRKFSDPATAALSVSFILIGLVSQFLSSSIGDLLQRDGLVQFAVGKPQTKRTQQVLSLRFRVILSWTVLLSQSILIFALWSFNVRWFALVNGIPSGVLAIFSGLLGRLVLANSNSAQVIAYNVFWMFEVVILCFFARHFGDHSWIAAVLCANTLSYCFYTLMVGRKLDNLLNRSTSPAAEPQPTPLTGH
jgi:hypothetical protein